jgi:hypothetical protein
VKALNLPASTRSFRRVGRCLPALTTSSRATLAGTFTTSLRRVARRGLANAVRPFAPRKITVLRRALALKFVPRIVSVSPTSMRIGVTRVIFGFAA